MSDRNVSWFMCRQRWIVWHRRKVHHLVTAECRSWSGGPNKTGSCVHHRPEKPWRIEIRRKPIPTTLERHRLYFQPPVSIEPFQLNAYAEGDGYQNREGKIRTRLGRQDETAKRGAGDTLSNIAGVGAFRNITCCFALFFLPRLSWCANLLTILNRR